MSALSWATPWHKFGNAKQRFRRRLFAHVFCKTENVKMCPKQQPCFHDFHFLNNSQQMYNGAENPLYPLLTVHRSEAMEITDEDWDPLIRRWEDRSMMQRLISNF